MRVRPASTFRKSALCHSLAAAFILTASSMSAFAEDVRLNLSGDKEVPPVSTMAMATGVISVNTDMTVSGAVTTNGIAATMAHIHYGKMATNGPVLIGLVKNGDNVWRVPDGAKLTEEQYRAFKAGDLYVNVHSAEHKGGEIRAQMMPAAAAK